ncbi:MAG TPA: Gfo/Idh/MocA family oxidoreductase [Tepidisphaeraceae bacterium]|nr:Gfo/Idh/MocA family oxidoreductase [Tepidisphaeraceae bacterium]
MADKVRWGILSTGNIARQFAAGVATSRRCIVDAVGSRQRESADAFARTHGIPHAFGSYRELIRCPEVDAVYVALPNSEHHAWTVAALREGKHVLCEKPLASNTAEAEDMFLAAEKHKRVLVEAFMYRSHPQTLAVMEAVKSGAIGELKLIRTSFCYRTRRIEGNIRFDKSLAGGGLMDVGCYCINFSRALAGAEPVKVEVTGHLHESGVDDLAAGTLTFPNGIVASFTTGMTVHADNTAYVCGSEGYIEIPVPWKPTKDKSEFTIARATPPRMDAVGQPVPAAPPRERRMIPVELDLFGIEADDFAATIRDGSAPRITPADSLGNMRVLDAMRRSLGVL